MLTITVPFSGKLFCLTRVLESLYNLDFSTGPVKVVFLDNSGNDLHYQRLESFLKEYERPFEKVLLKEDPGTFKSVTDIYNYLKPHVRGDWLTLEDDVIEIPSDSYLKMKRYLLSNCDVGIVSSFMESRRGYPGPMSWMVEKWEEIPGLAPVFPKGSGVGLVDATHTSFTLIKPSVYRDYTFRERGINNQIIGHDIYMCLDAAEKGIKTAVIWDIRPGHASEKGVYYTAMPSKFSIIPELIQKNPLVSIITPSCGRTKHLRRLIQELQKQTYKEFEHLICNDGLSRTVASVVESFHDRRIRYFELGHPYGYSGAPQRNALLQKASGELVVFVDDDVELKTDYLETMVNLWNSGFSVGCAQIEVTEKDGNVLLIPETKEKARILGNIDTLCFYVDTVIAKGFFWDLFEEHDFRYWQSVLSYTKGAYGFVSKIVGKSVRNYGHVEESENIPKNVDLVRKLADSLTERTPEAEPLILTDAQACLTYIVNCLGSRRWELAEKVISKNAKASLFYISNVLRSRFIEAEKLLASTPRLAVAYSKVIQKRWLDLNRPDVENMILSDPLSALEYCESVIKGPWKEVESSIKSNSSLWSRYTKVFKS